MPSDRKPSLILPVALALSLLLAGYVGAYYAMVERLVVHENDAWVLIAFYRLPVEWNEREKWHDRVAPAFAPIHRIDRCFRPRYWDQPLAEPMILEAAGLWDEDP